ncbi:MAG: multidrug effflux MFS transporter [Actinobacteria bacterium]|nr:multidrug effflux MFS transporter [Actinomycetota bacterium]
MSVAAAGDDSGRAAGIHVALLGTLTIVISMTPCSVDAFLPALPAAREALGSEASAMQLTLSAFLLGIAAGQLVFGPISDRMGRRMPLIAGATLCAIAAVVCALAPSIEVLVAARFVQGLAGSSGTVISKAIIRDRTAGSDAVHFLAMTAVGSGALNILAPVLGGLLAERFGWRGPLWFIAVVATAMVLMIVIVVPETHAPHLRDGRSHSLGLSSVIRHVSNRGFLIYVLVQAGSYGTLMAYVAASPFVYQSVLGFDGAAYGILFAANAACGVLGNLVANRYLRWVGSRRLVAIGLSTSLLGTAATGAAWMLGAPAWAVAVCITLSMTTINLNGPNLVGLALDRVTRSTGSAAAIIGFVQFCVGSLVAPVVGAAGSNTLAPMLITMAVLAAASLALLVAARVRS